MKDYVLKVLLPTQIKLGQVHIFHRTFVSYSKHWDCLNLEQKEIFKADLSK